MTDYSELVQRLRLLQEHLQDGDAGEAADAIKAQAKRIAELEAALKPFTFELLPQHNVFGCKQVFVKPEELAAARKILGENK